jgi:hypothetical protein
MLEISFRRERTRLVAGALTGGVRMTSRRSRARRRKVLVTEAMTHPGPCQVRIYTESPCLGRAEVEILGIPFCEACARQQEAYFSIGELTHEEGRDLRHENRGSLSLGALTRGLLDNPS